VIYCVKIRQKKISLTRTDKRVVGIKFFPFDRFYLISQDDTDTIQKIFQYFFYLKLTDELVAIISRYNFEEIRLIPAVDRPTIIPGVESELSEKVWNTLLTIPHTIIVPTYPLYIRKKVNENDKNNAIPAYYMTKAIMSALDNTELLLPQIGLHTPQRDVQLICAICQNYPGYCVAECSPGRGTCRQHIRIPIVGGKKL
jgi:hypothetical protein